MKREFRQHPVQIGPFRRSERFIVVQRFLFKKTCLINHSYQDYY